MWQLNSAQDSENYQKILRHNMIFCSWSGCLDDPMAQERSRVILPFGWSVNEICFWDQSGAFNGTSALGWITRPNAASTDSINSVQAVSVIISLHLCGRYHMISVCCFYTRTYPSAFAWLAVCSTWHMNVHPLSSVCVSCRRVHYRP